MTEIFISNNPFEPDDSQFIFIERKDNYDKDRNIYLDQVAEEKGIVFLPRAIREELGCEVDVFYDSIMPNLPDIYSPIYDNVAKGLEGECGIIHFTGYASEQGLVYSYWCLGNKNLRECDFAQLKKDIEELEVCENYCRNISNSSSQFTTQLLLTQRNPFVLYKGRHGESLDITAIALKLIGKDGRSKSLIENKKLPKLVLTRNHDDSGVYHYQIHFEPHGEKINSVTIGPANLAMYIAMMNAKEITLDDPNSPNSEVMEEYYRISKMPYVKYYGEVRCKELLEEPLSLSTPANKMIYHINECIVKALGKNYKEYKEYEQFLPIFTICKVPYNNRYYLVARGNLVDITAWNNTKTEYEEFLKNH